MLLRKLLKLDSDLYSFILKDRGRHYKTARIRISHKAIPYSEDYFGRLPGREGMRRRSVSRSLFAFGCHDKTDIQKYYEPGLHRLKGKQIQLYDRVLASNMIHWVGPLLALPS